MLLSGYMVLMCDHFIVVILRTIASKIVKSIADKV